MNAADELIAAFWSTISKIADKEATRDHLVDGAAYEVRGRVELTISRRGGFDDVKLEQRVAAVLLVGHATTKNTSSTPKLPEVLAAVLLSIPPKKRRELLATIASAFEQQRCLFPAPPAAVIAEAEEFLARLRTTKQDVCRGPVKAEYQLASR